MTFCWIITLIGSIVGAFFLFVGLVSSKGAPQEAAAGAIAAAFAVVPYVFTRAVEGLRPPWAPPRH